MLTHLHEFGISLKTVQVISPKPQRHQGICSRLYDEKVINSKLWCKCKYVWLDSVMHGHSFNYQQTFSIKLATCTALQLFFLCTEHGIPVRHGNLNTWCTEICTGPCFIHLFLSNRMVAGRHSINVHWRNEWMNEWMAWCTV